MKPCLINFRRTQCHYTKQRRIIAISKQQIANLRLPVNLRQMAAGGFLAIFFSPAVAFFSLHLRQMINVTNALEKISLWNERPLLPLFRYGCQPNFSFCLPSTKCRYEEQTYTTNKMINQRKSNLKNKRYKMMWRSELFVFNCLFVIPIRRGTNEKLGRPLAALRWISA